MLYETSTEHLIIEELENNLVKITAEEGYRLYNTRTRKYYSEAIVDKSMVKFFKAVE